MIISNRFLIDDFINFYSNLNPYGLLIFYGIVFILILGIVLIIIWDRSHGVKLNTDIKKEEVIVDKAAVKDDKEANNINAIARKIEEDMNSNISLTDFEDEQEKKSIISYDELVKKIKPAEEEANDELIDEDAQVDNIMDKKFVTSPMISPVFGYSEKDIKKEMAREYIKKVSETKSASFEAHNDEELEKTININNLGEDIKRNDEFLKALKDLKNNLD